MECYDVLGCSLRVPALDGSVSQLPVGTSTVPSPLPGNCG